jgi:hypothetical protein
MTKVDSAGRVMVVSRLTIAVDVTAARAVISSVVRGLTALEDAFPSTEETILLLIGVALATISSDQVEVASALEAFLEDFIGP